MLTPSLTRVSRIQLNDYQVKLSGGGLPYVAWRVWPAVFGSFLRPRIIVLGLFQAPELLFWVYFWDLGDFFQFSSQNVCFCTHFGHFQHKSQYSRSIFRLFCELQIIVLGLVVICKLLFWVWLSRPPPVTPDILPIESPPRGLIAV